MKEDYKVDKQAFLDYICRLPLFVIGAFIASFLISQLQWVALFNFDKTTFLDGLVAFNTGASIAVFLSLIQSNETYIKKLREHGRASRDVYMTVFLNTFLVVIANGLSYSAFVLLGIGFDNIATTIAVMITIHTLFRIKTLLNLYLK